MYLRLCGLAALYLSTSTAYAAGLDRSGQSVAILFEKGNYAEFSIGHAKPDVSGNDVSTLNPFETASGDVTDNFTQLGAGIKYQFSDQMSFALIYDQPFGSDVSYAPSSGDPTETGSSLLGGTQAHADTDALTALMRYQFNENWSVHGGLRYQRAEARIRLSGAAYGPFSGYDIHLDSERDLGWVIGGAYEIPEIALRLAVTYNSEIKHRFSSAETFAALGGAEVRGSKTVKTPQSVNIDFQTGIAADTLLFGSARWADNSAMQLNSTTTGPLPSVALIDLDNQWTFNLGVGRKFNENWSGSVSVGYEDKGDDLVSPLAPTNGMKSIGLGLQYTQNNVKISGGIRYTKLGDAYAETGTPDVARAKFDDNDAVSFGVKIGFYF